jgi:hypothetical protein
MFNNMPIKRNVTESRELRAWFGTVPDVMALVKVVEAMYLDARQEAAAQVNHALGWEKSNYQSNWQPEATVFEPGDVVVSGPLEEVLRETPAIRVRKIMYYYPGWRHIAGSQVTLRFNMRGLEVTVEGCDPVQVHSMASVIYDRASQSNPSWTFLLSVKGYLLQYAVVFAVVYFLALGVSRNLGMRAPGIVALSPASFMAAAAGFTVQFPRLFPRFELLRPGGSPRAERMLKWLGTLVASALVGAIFSFAIT